MQGSRSVEERLDEALDSLRALTRRVDDLSRRLGVMEGAGSSGAPIQASAADPAPAAVEDAPPSMMGWVGRSRLLQRIAMTSFVLVVALVLRTLTDSRLIGVGVGVVLGMAYSALLVALGAWLLARHGRGRRVLPACGAVLLCSVAVEAHRRFHLVTAGTVNWILIADMIVVGALGLRFRMGSLVTVAVLAPALSALTVGFPNLEFPLVAAVFLLANAVAHLARRVGRLQWLGWTTFAMTVFFMFLWSVKVRAHLLHPEAVPAVGLGTTWFLPWLSVFALVYAGTSVVRSIAAPRAPGAFHAFLPTGNVLWAHPTAAAVVGPSTGGLFGLGAVALGAAALHLGFAAWLWRRARVGGTGITSFAVAGAVLLALGVPTLVQSLPLELAVLAAVGLGLALFAAPCGSPGLRLLALLLQLAVCVWSVAGELYAVPPVALAANVSAAVFLAVAGSWQYLHDRAHPPPAGSWLARIDPSNHAGIVLLWGVVVAAFGTLRLLLDRILALLGEGMPDAFQCGQSVILNCVSIAMLAWGLHSRNRQVLLTGALVALVGGLKVFGSDLLSASGLPLVLAVFSFGVAAAVGSIVLSRLQRTGAAPSDATAES